MEALNSLKLIQGEFTPENAREILLTLIDSKVQFHQLKSFSSEIKFGFKDQHSLDRITDLKQMKIEILKIIELADFQQKNLSIESVINIAIKA